MIFFHLGSSMGENLNYRHVNKGGMLNGGWAIVNRCRLCKESEEFADHILIHCEDKGVMDVPFINFWSELSVFSCSTKLAHQVEV